MRYVIPVFIIFFSVNMFAQELDTVRVERLLEKVDSVRVSERFDISAKYLREILEMEGLEEREDLYSKAMLKYIFSLSQLRDFEGANEMIERLESYFEKQTLPDPAYVADLLMFKGDLADLQGDLMKSNVYLKAALAKYMEVNTPQGYGSRGDIYNSLGINAARMTEFDLASDYFQQSLVIFDSLQSKWQGATATSNLGNLYKVMGSSALAAEYFRKSLDIKKDVLGEWHISLARTYNNLSALSAELAQYNLACDYQNMAIAVLRENDMHNQEYYFEYNLNLSACYVRLKDFDNAFRALTVAKETMEKPVSIRPYLKAFYEFSYGYYYSENGEYEKAIIQYKKAIPLYESLPEAPVEAAQTIFDLGIAYAKVEEYDLAIQYTEQGISDLIEIFGSKHHSIANAYSRIADWYAARSEFEEALKTIDLAISASVDSNENGTPDLDKVSHRTELLSVLITKGNLLRNGALERDMEHRVQQALKNYQLADTLIRSKQETEAFSDQLIFLETLDQLYDQLVSTLYDFYSMDMHTEDLQLAFQYANRGNSVLLRHQEKQISDRKFGRVSEEVIALERQLKEGISYIRSQIFNLENAGEEVNEAKLNSLKSRLFNKNRSLDSLKLEIEDRFPTYFNYMYATDLPTMSEVEASLGRGVSFVQYVTTEDDIYAFKFHNGESQFIKLDLADNFNEDLNTYLDILSNPVSGLEADHMSISTALYDQLIRPLGELNEELRILTDGVLSRLPFETLADSELAETAIPYLIGRHNISYINNINQLAQPKTSTKSASRLNVLAIAPAYDTSLDTPDQELRSGLGKLNYTVEEVEALEDLYNTEIYSRENATEKAFRVNSDNKNILHIASHALVSGDDPLSSRIVFEQDENDSLNDGSLFVHELYNLSLDADLVVLSACNTGSGELADGEGILSLGRGFQYAGVRSVVLSHWQVNDQATSAIMTAFHKNLVKGQKKSEALRNAKLEYIGNASNLTASPFFWGAFVVIGNDAPLTGQSNWYIYALLVVVAVLLYFTLRAKKPHSKV